MILSVAWTLGLPGPRIELRQGLLYPCLPGGNGTERPWGSAESPHVPPVHLGTYPEQAEQKLKAKVAHTKALEKLQVKPRFPPPPSFFFLLWWAFSGAGRLLFLQAR